MIKLSDGTVWLEENEVFPCWCTCGEIYQPKYESASSICPKCGALNDHSKQKMRRIVNGQIADQ